MTITVLLISITITVVITAGIIFCKFFFRDWKTNGSAS